MKKANTKRIIAAILTFVMLITTFILPAGLKLSETVSAASHPYPLLLDYTDLNSSFNSIAASKILPAYRTYVLNALKYHIESDTSSYRVAKNLMKAYNSNADGNVIFFFDGCSVNLSGATPCFSGYKKNGYRYNMSCVCIVLQKNSSGRAQIVYASANTSTMPDNVRNASLNDGTPPGSLRDGIYDVKTTAHGGSYAALNIVTSANTHVRSCTTRSSYISQGSGINIHRRAYSFDYITNSTYNSTGCFNIGGSSSDKTEYNAFIKAVTGYSNGGSGCSGYTTGKSVGITIVDRSNYKTQLSTIYGNDSDYGISGGWSGSYIASMITTGSADWHTAINAMSGSTDPEPTYKEDTRYPVPFNAYTLTTGTTYDIYDTIEGTVKTGGYIEGGDRCTINTVYTNGWVNVTYPVSSGTKTVFTRASVFFSTSYTPTVKNAVSALTAYRRSDLSTSIGALYVGDVCTIVGESGNNYQFITTWESMPAGKVLAWVSKSAFGGSSPATYTVSYNANGGTGAPSSQTKTQGTALTLSSTKPSKSFTLTYNANGGSVSPSSVTLNCTFVNWKSSSDSATYAPGGSYTKDAATTMTAQWTNPKAGTLATPTRSGYTFAGWSLSQSGGSVISSTTEIQASATIYAQWSGGSTATQDTRYPVPFNAYTITTGTTYDIYDKIDGTKTGGYIEGGDRCTINTVYTNGWVTVTYPVSSGTKTVYARASVFFDASYTPVVKNAVSALTAYRRSDLSTSVGALYVGDVCTIVGESGNNYQFITTWESVPAGKVLAWVSKSAFGGSTPSTYTVSYNANGGSGAPSSQTKTQGTALTLSSTKPSKSFTLTYNANGGSVSPSSVTLSCTFANWKSSSDSATYAPGGSYTKDAATTMTAQWTNPKAGTLATPTRSGYTFAGWSLSKSGGSVISSATEIQASATVYAQWYNSASTTYTVSYNANGGTGAPAAQTKTQGTGSCAEFRKTGKIVHRDVQCERRQSISVDQDGRLHIHQLAQQFRRNDV